MRKLVYFLAAVSLAAVAANYSRMDDLIIKNSMSVGSNQVPDSKAVLDLVSTTKGFLPPRYTTTNRASISSPTEGLEIYNLTTHTPNFYTGSAWTAFVSSGSITNSDIASNAAIARSKIAAGSVGQIVYNDGSTGLLSSEALVTTAQGGTGIDLSASTGILHDVAGTISASSVSLVNDVTGSVSLLKQVSGILPAKNGGTGQDFSGSTGTLQVVGGTVSAGSVALATNVSGMLSAVYGGTGSNSLTLNNVLLGNATSPVKFVAPGAAGQVLTSDGTTWASSASASGFSNPMNAAGQLIVGGSGGAATVLSPSATSGQVLSVVSSTSIAYINAPVGAYSVASKSSTYSVLTSDTVVEFSGGSFTATLPTIASVPTGKVYILKHVGTSLTQVYTLATADSATIGGIASGSYAMYTNGETLTIYSNGSSWSIQNHITNNAWNAGANVSFSASTTAPTKGTITRDTIKWRREGQFAKIRIEYWQSATGSSANGSGIYYFLMPTGLVIDTNFVTASTDTTVATVSGFAQSGLKGTFWIFAGSNNRGIFMPDVRNSGAFGLVGYNSSTTTGQWDSGSGMGLNSGQVGVGGEGEFPIVGWQP